MVRMILLIPVLLGTMAVTASTQATPSDLAGLYICDGVGPDGAPYQALVEITKNNDTYQLLWWFESQVVGIGLGIRSGDVLAVMHYSGLPGVVAYRIEEGPRLVGQWTVVQDTLEAAGDPQTIANGYLQECRTAAGVPFQMVAAPVQFDEEPAAPGRAPEFNEHGDEILADIGLDMDAIIDLKVRGVVA